MSDLLQWATRVEHIVTGEHEWAPWDGRFAMPDSLPCLGCGMTAAEALHPYTFAGQAAREATDARLR